MEAIPKLPTLSASGLSWRHPHRVTPSILDSSRLRFFKLGRIALDAALRLTPLQAGDEVLLPAYHCVSMVEPVLRAEARPVFYRVLPDARVELEDLERRITARTRAIVVPHYFGFPQPMEDVLAVCRGAGVSLIEDCAHALFGSLNGRPLGSFGDYAIASPWKFLPVIEGGCLAANDQALATAVAEPVRWKEEVKALLNGVESALGYGRLRAVSPLLKPLIGLANLRSRRARLAAFAEPEPDPRRAVVDPNARLSGMSRFSQAIMRHTDRDRLVRRRRQAYQWLAGEWGAMRRARPLHPELPDGVVPQVFPLVVDWPETAFPRLKAAGVPIIRFGEFFWEGMDASVCRNTDHLSRSVFQLPCHQELTDEELQWLAETVRSTLDG